MATPSTRWTSPRLDKQKKWKKKAGIGDLLLHDFGLVDDNTILVGDDFARYYPDFLVEYVETPPAIAAPVSEPVPEPAVKPGLVQITPELVSQPVSVADPEKEAEKSGAESIREEEDARILHEMKAAAEAKKAAKPKKAEKEPPKAGESIVTSSKNVEKP